MKWLEFVRERRRERRDYLKNALEAEQRIAEKRIEAKKELIEKFPLIASYPRIFSGTSKDDEPFGWAPGTVRGIITIWVVMTFCIITMWCFMTGAEFIPKEWYLGIVGAIIMSYFYTRYKMTN